LAYSYSKLKKTRLLIIEIEIGLEKTRTIHKFKKIVSSKKETNTNLV